MSQQSSDKSQISLLVSLCLLICGTTLMKAGSLLPWRENPENGGGGCPGASQELALLHFFAFFARNLVRLCQEYPGEISACFVKSSWSRGWVHTVAPEPGPWSSVGNRPKQTASDRTMGAMVRGPWAGTVSPPFIHSGTLKGVSRQGSLQGALSH